MLRSFLITHIVKNIFTFLCLCGFIWYQVSAIDILFQFIQYNNGQWRCEENLIKTRKKILALQGFIK